MRCHRDFIRGLGLEMPFEIDWGGVIYGGRGGNRGLKSLDCGDSLLFYGFILWHVNKSCRGCHTNPMTRDTRVIMNDYQQLRTIS